MSSNRWSIRLVTCVSVVGVVVLALAVLVAPRALSARADSGQGNRQDLKNYQHVFVIMMENTGFDSLIGNANAPWINMAAQTYGLATNYFGVTHPSQPNYIAATSGSTNGVTSDNDTTIDVPNIVDFSQFSSNLANKNVPDYVWISPDQCTDMHGRGGPASDPCSFAHNTPIQNADLIATGDAFLHSTVSAIVNDLRSLSGGLWLPLDSTAPRHT